MQLAITYNYICWRGVILHSFKAQNKKFKGDKEQQLGECETMQKVTLKITECSDDEVEVRGFDEAT